jgi:hypothetical protein
VRDLHAADIVASIDELRENERKKEGTIMQWRMKRELVGILVSESMETRERVTKAMLYYIGGSVQI